MKFTPSHFQEEVRNFIQRGSGNAIVEAVAGSGKTSTIVWIDSFLPPSATAIFVAFNKHISTELAGRLVRANSESKTMHSVGMNLIRKHLSRRTFVSGKKYFSASLDVLDNTGFEKREQYKMASVISKIIGNSRTLGIDPSSETFLEEEMWQVVNRFNIDIAVAEQCQSYIQPVYKVGMEKARSGVIDFTDMIYLPYIWDIKPVRRDQYDYVFVDEAQDLNVLQQSLAKRIGHCDSRYVFVGDSRQAIYGFAGADAQSFSNIKEMYDAVSLPLSITYRCPTSVVELARKYVPQIMASETAEEGTVSDIEDFDLQENLVPKSLVLCRINAPLVGHCIKSVIAGVPSYVKGKDIGQRLIEVIKKIKKMDGYSFDDFEYYADVWRGIQEQLILKRGNKSAESTLHRMNDDVNCIVSLYEYTACDNESCLVNKIKEMFLDYGSGVCFSSVHKAKGLESDNVFILHPEKMPLIWKDQKASELIQEHNIYYVAITRTKKNLFFVRNTNEQ